LGLHRIQKGKVGGYIYLVVAINILYSPQGLTMDLKFDLKGRKPKREIDQLPKEAAKGSIWKDNQLSRRFFPDYHLRKPLLESIENDVNFLKAHDIIDYSLLVGVHLKEKAKSVEGSDTEKKEGRGNSEKSGT